ncbi:MAG TPA: GNAT family N-acetyltransferase [Caldilineae bacterium]|nr:GNAT family N-acetyltransferase [Caldilineae bacterium]
MRKDRADSIERITLRPMTFQDIPLGMRLKEAAGWNQLEADWEMLLRASSRGCFVAAYDGVDAGTVTTVTYQRRFSWIGMALVDPAYRRRGIGTALLKAAIRAVQDIGPVRLDATPLGRKLYDLLGFKEEYRLLRMGCRPNALTLPSSPACHQVTEDVFPALVRLDASVFGAEREMILRSLLRRAPQFAFLAKSGEEIVGYCLGRPGSRFDQIGPVVAEGEEAARALLLAALSHIGSKGVILDVPLYQQGWIAFLRDLGFTEQRPFVRMYLGGSGPFGRPEWQFAIAGPEIG